MKGGTKEMEISTVSIGNEADEEYGGDEGELDELFVDLVSLRDDSYEMEPSEAMQGAFYVYGTE